MKEPIDLLIEQSLPKHSIWYYYLDGVLIKEKKPCTAGSRVHVHRWEGVYTVLSAIVTGFYVMKQGERKFLPWSEFRCLYGRGTSYESKLKRELRNLEAKSNDAALKAFSVQQAARSMVIGLRDYYEP